MPIPKFLSDDDWRICVETGRLARVLLKKPAD